MARDPSERVAVRVGYLRGLTLEAAAMAARIPLGTARKWKVAAAEAGDDWDRLRAAQLLAGGSREEVMGRVLAAAINQAEATLDAVKADAKLAAPVQVQMLASLADSLNKMVVASGRLAPQTDVLAVRLENLKRLAEFVRREFPQHAAALVEVLEAFGEEVANG